MIDVFPAEPSGNATGNATGTGVTIESHNKPEPRSGKGIQGGPTGFLAAFGAKSQTIEEIIFSDALSVWNSFRDPANGAWCDTLRFTDDPSALVDTCGESNNFYSSAGTGMGLVSEAISAQLGLQTDEQARERVMQTLLTFTIDWPREPTTGFLVHFSNRNFETLSEFSTIDTAIVVLGAMFAGNYLGGEALELATELMSSVSWSDAIESADSPTIYPVADEVTGEMSGDIRPYNEYYLVAYLAKINSNPGSKAEQYFETYFGSTGSPPGDDYYPVHKNYWGYDLLTDNPNIFMSSFIPQFCYYLSKAYQENLYYSSNLHYAWLQADILYWSLALSNSSTIWGTEVYGKVWGAGAGPSPSGYGVERIDGSPDLVISAAIMAGFLPAADDSLRSQINEQLSWLYDNNVCAYETHLPDGTRPKILWRCSVRLSDWRAPSVDSIDFSTMILGLATNFLPQDFYLTYSA